MKRSLSFTNLKGLGPHGNDNDTGHVRKIQSCAARFYQENDFSIDFLDNLLDEYENEDNNSNIYLSYSSPVSSQLVSSNDSNNNLSLGDLNLNDIKTENNNNNNDKNNNNDNNNDKLKPMFTTHDLTTLLSFLTPPTPPITTISSKTTQMA